MTSTTVQKKVNSIIINADDFGLNHETNLAIIDLLKTNRIQRATLMVNMPFTEDAVEMVKANHLESKIGLHLNITDGCPLSNLILKTRFCSDGHFLVRQVESGVRLYAKHSERKAIEEEVVAQFEMFKNLMGLYPKHIDSHRHAHNYLGYLFTILHIAKMKDVKSMRIGINLYDHKRASIAKKVYKFVLNTIIKSSFEHTDYMGAYLEYINYFKSPKKGKKDKSVEIMVHPTIRDGQIYDIIYDENERVEYYTFDNIVL